MQSKSRSLIYILIFGLLLTLFFVYRYGFQDRYLNLSIQTALVDLSKQNTTILIEKHPDQKRIKHLEIRIKGKLSDNITLYLSENGITAFTSIRIKSGRVDTSFLTEWKKEKAYLLIENLSYSKSTMEIDYQFISE